MHFVYHVYFSRSPFGEGGKRILNVLLASHRKGEQNDVLVISVLFFFFLKYCFVEEILCFLVIVSFFKNVSPEMIWDFLLFFGELC